MEVSKIIDGINKKKAEMNISNQTIADASGVPKSTVDRILRKDTENPSAQNILDIAAAVGYRIGGDIEKPPFPADEKLVEYIMQLNDDRISRMRAGHNQVLAEKDRRIENYEKYIHGLIIAVILLVAIIILMLVVDVIHPDIGWIRQQVGAARSTIFVGPRK